MEVDEDINEGEVILLEKISEGTFSEVYKAKWNDQLIAVKLLHPICSADRVLTEIIALTVLDGLHNVVPILGGVRDLHENTLLLKYFPHDHFRSYYTTLEIHQLQHYLRCLFQSLAHCHRHGIIHRDIKPNNFLYNRTTEECMLIDFGLSQPACKETFNRAPGTPRSCSDTSALFNNQLPKVERSGTRGFRAPEILLRVPEQTPAIDIWCVGVILLSIVSGRYPVFCPEDDFDALNEIADMIGTEQVCIAASNLNRELIFSKKTMTHTWKEASLDIRSSNDKRFFPDSLYDLMSKCLDIHPDNRITAEEALQSEFINIPKSELVKMDMHEMPMKKPSRKRNRSRKLRDSIERVDEDGRRKMRYSSIFAVKNKK